MPKESAGILLYRHGEAGVQVFLVHPGGPYWSKRDRGAWMIPKGETMPGEDPLFTARREFAEETGFVLDAPCEPLEPIRQKGGKSVRAWMANMDVRPDQLKSNTFQMEWPPRSGRLQTFPEVDRAAWFSLQDARTYMLESQRPLLDQLQQRLKST